MSTSFVSLHATTALAERIVDIPGYVPGLSLFTLPARVTIAAFQTLFALANAIYLGYLTFTQPEGVNVLHERLMDKSSRHMAYFASNAFQNLCRGTLESIPLVGNAACIAWDWQKSQLSEADLTGSWGPIGKTDWHRPLMSHLLYTPRYSRNT